jgi:hypothetical protein
MAITPVTTTPTRRETSAEHRGRRLIVTLHPHFLTIGEKRRDAFAVPYDAVYELALKLEARRTREETRRAS